MRDEKRKFYKTYYSSMVGATVAKAGVTPDGFPFFVLKKRDGTTYQCEVSQDPEGNGPGFLFGLPTPTK